MGESKQALVATDKEAALQAIIDEMTRERTAICEALGCVDLPGVPLKFAGVLRRDLSKARERIELALSTPAADAGWQDISDKQIEAMVAAMVKQSTEYPVVPPDYTGKVEALNQFTARQCLLAALKVARPPLNPEARDER